MRSNKLLQPTPSSSFRFSAVTAQLARCIGYSAKNKIITELKFLLYENSSRHFGGNYGGCWRS